ncbi:MAG: glycoside hydrolase family 2 TIM barrel-domain containing protein [Phycisphaerae bacterium]
MIRLIGRLAGHKAVNGYPGHIFQRETHMSKPTQFVGMNHPKGQLLTILCLFLWALSPLRGAEMAGPIRQGMALLTEAVPLDGGDWLLGLDPKNVGRQDQWCKEPQEGAKRAKVPGVIQDVYPDYHGLAWYWRDFTAPANPHSGGRYLLRFGAVDYLADVYVNGILIGCHEGSQEPFVLDATSAVKSGGPNRLAVRVLNPTYESIDGISLHNAPVGRRQYPKPVDNAYNTGGIIDSVELLLAPAVRIEDLQVIPDWKTGEVRIRMQVRSTLEKPVSGHIRLIVAPAVGGASVVEGGCEQELAVGDTLVETRLRVPHHRLWELNDPYLYRVTASVQAADSLSMDDRSVRFGFRDFRFENGYFRMNGRRIYPHGGLYTILHYPGAQSVPYDEDLVRRDVLNMKAAGFNIVRITCGAAVPARQLDVCDEMGLLVCEEHFGAKGPAESPELEKRWDHSVTEVIRRDRNHPSVVIWSLLNEVQEGRVFRRAVQSLPLLRDLDESRMVLLNSGRFDGDGNIGSWSSPGSRVWEKTRLEDVHSYPSFPHSANTMREMRTRGGPLLLSEYGVCGAMDFPRFARNFEQLGLEHTADARNYKAELDWFLSEWKKLRLDQCWARPEDYFQDSQRTQAKLALDDYNTWMSNPNLVGDFTSTQIVDAWYHGCGITSYFREPKPGMLDAFQDMASKVRLCLFVEPVNVYRGTKVRLEAVLVNRDALKPGKYPVRIQVVGPNLEPILDKEISVEVPDTDGKSEPPFARLVFDENLVIDSPSGKCRFLATFQRGAAAGGGDVEFYVADPADAPAVKSEIVLWGEDERMADWLTKQGIRWRKFEGGQQSAREVILASGRAPSPGGAPVFSELARRIARGSAVVFLTPSGDTMQWSPLSEKPVLRGTPMWYFHADFWAKRHPILDGLPCGGIMDYRFYRDVISDQVFSRKQPPDEAVCGAMLACGGDGSSRSDLAISVHRLGEGRFILNSLRIRDSLGSHPAAERLLRNMLNYAAQSTDKPMAELPANFDEQLKAMGYVP